MQVHGGEFGFLIWGGGRAELIDCVVSQCSNFGFDIGDKGTSSTVSDCKVKNFAGGVGVTKGAVGHMQGVHVTGNNGDGFRSRGQGSRRTLHVCSSTKATLEGTYAFADLQGEDMDWLRKKKHTHKHTKKKSGSKLLEG